MVAPEGRLGQPWEWALRESTASVIAFAEAVAARDDSGRAIAAEKITDLFLAQAPLFNDSHVALFDQIICVLADAIEARARARLAERLADVPNAPLAAIRKLSRDEIAVARPVLARSPRLSDADLIAAARAGGRGHMLAISERKDLQEAVTDVLVAEGDRVVINAVASNPTARLSDKSYDQLIERSSQDELLQAAIARRRDIPQRHMSVLFELAKKAARDRLQTEIAQVSRRAVRDAVNSSAKDIAAETLAISGEYQGAVADVAAVMQAGGLDGPALMDFARRGKTAHVICGLAALGRVPVGLTERAVMGSDHDLLTILGKSLDIPWPTVRAILSMRKETKPGLKQLETLAESYAKLAPATAERLLRYLHARESVVAKR
jgi:uncharacterized protein (DUF2336 family)